MRVLFIKTVVRVLGGVIALSGVCLLGSVAFWFLPRFIASSNAFGLGLALFGVLLGLYFVRVGYLAWFRWSPLAVQHVVATSAFFLLGALGRFHPATIGQPNKSGIWSLASFLVVYILYRLTFAFLSRRLFPVFAPAAASQKRST